MSEIVDRRDLEFLLYEYLDLAKLCEASKYAAYDRDSVTGILDAAEALAEDAFLPFAGKVDANGPEFVDGRAISIPEVKSALEAYKEAGFFGMSFDEELGGLQMPYMLSLAVTGMFSAANGPIQGYAMLTNGAANMLNACGSDEQKQKYLPAMIEGRWFGTMCLSETQAGSSLSDIRTKAEPRDDGYYNLSGTKMWISGGEQELSENIVHMVLAKIPGGPPGVKGISLFIVPKYRVNADGSIGEKNNIVLAGLNHKMGQIGLPNTVLNFGEGGESIGELVGEPHRGLSYMFVMMNEARINVGYGAAMSGLAGYLHSLAYARDRLQGRHPQNKDPQASQVPIIEHADIRRMLLAQKAQVEGSQALGLYCAQLVDKQAVAEVDARRNELALLLEILTPVAKSYASEFCLEANKLAIQILGGYGYTKDYPVERLYRDNRLNMIHEGTHGIQGLDLLGRKVQMFDGAALSALSGRIEATIENARGNFEAESAALESMLAKVHTTVSAVRACDNATLALANATLFLDAFGQVVIAWTWLGQALAARRAEGKQAGDANYYAAKLATMRYYFRYELPKASHSLDLVASLDDTALNLDTQAL